MEFLLGLVVGAVIGAVVYGLYVKSFTVNVIKEP